MVAVPPREMLEQDGVCGSNRRAFALPDNQGTRPVPEYKDPRRSETTLLRPRIRFEFQLQMSVLNVSSHIFIRLQNRIIIYGS
jgi:hypothetical protein